MAGPSLAGLLLALCGAAASAQASAQAPAAATARLQGRITDGHGQPVPAAMVTVLDAQARTELARTAADGEGLYLAPRVPRDETIVIRVEAAGFATQHLVSQPRGAARLEQFQLRQGGRLRGRVVGPDGAGIGGAEVFVQHAGLADARDQLRGVTDGDGAFEVAGAPLGTVRIYAYAQRHGLVVDHALTGGREVVLEMPRASATLRTLSATGLTAGERAHAHFLVEALGVEHRLPLDADGTAQLPPLLTQHRVRLELPGVRVVPHHSKCRPGELLDRSFEPSRTPAPPQRRVVLRGRLVDESGHAVVGAHLALRDRTNRRFATRTDGDGAFAIEAPLAPQVHAHLGLLVDDRVLSSARPKNEGGWSWLPVTIDRDDELEFETEPAAAVRGVVRDRDGAPLPYVTLRLIPDHPKLAARRFGALRGTMGAALPRGHTDRAGRLHLAGLSAGTYELRVVAPDGQLGTTDLAVRPGESTELPTLRWQPTAVIEGRVVGSDGRPLQGVEVLASATDRTSYWLPQRSLTDRDGRYRIRGVPAGPATVSCGPLRDQQTVELPGEGSVRVDF